MGMKMRFYPKGSVHPPYAKGWYSSELLARERGVASRYDTIQTKKAWRDKGVAGALVCTSDAWLWDWEDEDNDWGPVSP